MARPSECGSSLPLSLHLHAMSRLTPSLMFIGKAEEAMLFYVETFPESHVGEVERWGEGEPGEAGRIKRALATVGGQTLQFNDSPDVHAFTFTPAISLTFDCASENEVDELAAKLEADGGKALMPVGDYGFSKRFAWVQDRFGVSWQLNCA